MRLELQSEKSGLILGVIMLNTQVLILNKGYQPVNVVDVRRALCMFYVGAAHALDREYRLFDFHSWTALSAEFNDEVVGTVNRRILIPRILVLQAYNKMPLGRVRFSRRNIFLRDSDTCQYCGKRLPRSGLNLDHVIPRSQGGKTNWRNIVASCIKCNSKKGGRTPSQAHMHLIREPRKPRWSELRNLVGPRLHYQEWLPFLNPVDASYWNTELSTD